MPQPTINTPRFLQLTPQAPAGSPAVSIRVALNERDGVYVNTAVTVEHPMVAVTSSKIAKLRIGALRRDALRSALSEENGDLAKTSAVKTFFKGTNGRAVSEKIRANPSTEHLESAVTVYRLAKYVGDFPVQSVARCLGIERTDAARWIATAKKAGLLTQTPGR